MSTTKLPRNVAMPLLQLVQQTIAKYERGEITEDEMQSVADGVRIAINSRVKENSDG